MTALIGYGSHGKDIETIYYRVLSVGRIGRLLRIYDADPTKGADPSRIEVDEVFLGINDPTGRRRLAESLAPGIKAAPPLIDPSAVLGEDIRLADGVVIAPNASLLRSVVLGAHVHANYGSQMTRCVVGDFSTLSPGATICGDVEIGEETLIGANATVCDRVKIGNRVRVGAGAIIPPLSIVPDDTTVIGVWKG